MATLFEESVITGDPKMRNQTRVEVREVQLVYRREQARQLREILEEFGLNPQEIQFYAVDFEKNLCAGTGLESESGILYNTRTGVSVGVMLDWACQWMCGKPEWRGQYTPQLTRCQPQYFFTHLNEKAVEDLR
ncbi:MAG: hypothetical protein WCS37_07090 [Chloroflexota bacterium]|nr:hypothetical protein [Chloroflexota bacterium]